MLFIYVSTSWIRVTWRICELQHVVSAIYFHTFGAFLYIVTSIFFFKLCCCVDNMGRLNSRLGYEIKRNELALANMLRNYEGRRQFARRWALSISLHHQSHNATEWAIVYKCKAQIWTFQDPRTQFQRIRKAYAKKRIGSLLTFFILLIFQFSTSRGFSRNPEGGGGGLEGSEWIYFRSLLITGSRSAKTMKTFKLMYWKEPVLKKYFGWGQYVFFKAGHFRNNPPCDKNRQVFSINFQNFVNSPAPY